jgi:hypothetical protein
MDLSVFEIVLLVLGAIIAIPLLIVAAVVVIPIVAGTLFGIGCLTSFFGLAE